MSKAEKPYDLHGEIAAWREGSIVRTSARRRSRVWRALVAPRVALFADELIAALEAAEARVADLEKRNKALATILRWSLHAFFAAYDETGGAAAAAVAAMDRVAEWLRRHESADYREYILVRRDDWLTLHDDADFAQIHRIKREEAVARVAELEAELAKKGEPHVD